MNIVLNGKVFTPSKSAALDTLFTGPVTAFGWYKVASGGVILYAMNGERVGGVNRHGCMYSSSIVYGELRHGFWDMQGVGAMEYRAKCDAADSIMNIWRAKYETPIAALIAVFPELRRK